MRTKLLGALLVILAACTPPPPLDEASADGTDYNVSVTSPRPVDEKTISIAILVDTSGSMEGKKIEELKTALHRTIDALGNQTSKTLEVGLFKFDVSAQTLVPLGPFNSDALHDAANQLTAHGGTGIGRALAYAERALDGNATGSRNILLLTDGMNESGRSPEEVFEHIIKTNQASNDAYTNLFVIGFDMDPKYFDPLANQGAYVSASEEGQLVGVMLGNVKRMLEALP